LGLGARERRRLHRATHRAQVPGRRPRTGHAREGVFAMRRALVFPIALLLALTSLLGSAPILLAAQQATPAASPVAGAAPVGDPAGADWLTYGGNLYNQR
jgi:Flp pilus assembly protein TadG